MPPWRLRLRRRLTCTGPGASCQGRGKSSTSTSTSTQTARQGPQEDTRQFLRKERGHHTQSGKIQVVLVTMIYSRTLGVRGVVSHAPGTDSRPQVSQIAIVGSDGASFTPHGQSQLLSPPVLWAGQCRCRQVRAHPEMTSSVPLSSGRSADQLCEPHDGPGLFPCLQRQPRSHRAHSIKHLPLLEFLGIIR